MSRKLLIGLILVVVGLAAVSSNLVSHAQDDDHEHTPEEVEAGYQLFLSNGCNACHGQNAEGSIIAPALAGHTAIQVRRQLRAPMGIMPVFTPEKIPDEDVELLIAFVMSLEGDHMHHTVDIAKQANWMYHWLAYSAIEAGDIDTATHYVEHISSLVVGEHLTMMQQIWAQLSVGETELARETLAKMLVEGDSPTPDMEAPDPLTLHLELAYIAAQSKSTDEVIHHLKHYIELTPDTDHSDLEALLEQFDHTLQETEHELGELLGTDGDGAMDMDHDDADEHESDMDMDHDDADEHDDDMDMDHDDADDHADDDMNMDMGDGHEGHTGFMVVLEVMGSGTITFTVTEEMLGEWEMGCFEQDGAHYLAGMVGTVTVVEGDGSGGEVSVDVELSEFSFTPNALEFAVGQHVTLNITNAGAIPHELMIGRNPMMTEGGLPSGYEVDFFAGSDAESDAAMDMGDEGHDDDMDMDHDDAEEHTD